MKYLCLLSTSLILFLFSCQKEESVNNVNNSENNDGYYEPDYSWCYKLIYVKVKLIDTLSGGSPGKLYIRRDYTAFGNTAGSTESNGEGVLTLSWNPCFPEHHKPHGDFTIRCGQDYHGKFSVNTQPYNHKDTIPETIVYVKPVGYLFLHVIDTSNLSSHKIDEFSVFYTEYAERPYSSSYITCDKKVSTLRKGIDTLIIKETNYSEPTAIKIRDNNNNLVIDTSYQTQPYTNRYETIYY